MIHLPNFGGKNNYAMETFTSVSNCNVKFTLKTEVSKFIPFLAVFIDNCNNVLKRTSNHKLAYLINFTYVFTKLVL